MKMKTENFLELCSDIAEAWLHDALIIGGYIDDIWEEKENGDEVYTEDVQDRFNDILDLVEQILTKNGITKA